MNTWNATHSMSLPRLWSAPLAEKHVLLDYDLHSEWFDAATAIRLLLVHDSSTSNHRSAGRYRAFRMTRSGRVDEITHAVLGKDSECAVGALGAIASRVGIRGYHFVARGEGFMRCIDRINYRLAQMSHYPLLHATAA